MQIIEFGTQYREILMLLHGGGLSWWNYRTQAELLADRYHVVLPVLDGHAGADAPFAGIAENADRIIEYIATAYGGSVLLLGGLSLGAQIVLEILSKRPDVCKYAVVESACTIASPVTGALIEPAFSAVYPLIGKKWFAGMQMRALCIREDLFDDYCRDSSAIRKDDMIAFLRANTAYDPKPDLKNCLAKSRIIVGAKERRKMRRSARLLHDLLPNSVLEVKTGLYHGEYSINRPERYVRELLAAITPD